MTDSNPVIEATSVQKCFKSDGNELEVLSDIDLSIRKGEFVAITGPSGSGKSTLLYLLGALDRPTKGSVRFCGEATTALSDVELARIRSRHVGFIFQFHFLLLELTALENVMVPALVAGERQAPAALRARDLLIRLGLGGRLGHRPVQLSGGEQQRVAIARAMVNQPALLLGDELTGNLDSATSEAIYQLLREQNHQCNQTIVIVTHNTQLANHADRIVEMVDGRIIQDVRSINWAPIQGTTPHRAL